MRKLIFLALIFTLFFGCENKPDSETHPTPKPEGEQPQQSATPEGYNAPARQTQTPPAESEIAKASTPLVDKSENRMGNVALAVEAIDGTKVAPGQEFSFNDAVGARTTKKGYKEAAIFVEDEKVDEIGGGVCQVATTIFQAARAADLEVTERHEHNQKVTYADQGDDATVFYGKMDMKFKNTTQKDIRIDCTSDSEQVLVKLVAVR